MIQPISNVHAGRLDQAVAGRVHTLLGFRFYPNTDILTLPVMLHGLGFPSITRFNRGMCLEGTLRDLNHRLPADRNC